MSRLGALSCVAIAAFACALIPISSASAMSLKENPFLQQGEKLTASGVSGLAEQGYSVAISADGDTAIVGAPYYNSFDGAAWVYTRSGSTWTQQEKLVSKEASGNVQQGYSVALSADGNTALVGGKTYEGTGATWVFTRSGTTWTERAKLVGKEASGDAEQGDSVALSGDGETALIGGYKDGGGVGAAWVFTGSGSSWTQQGKKLVGAHPVGVVEEGTSVALSGDGNTALVGGPFAESEKGGAWVFTRSGETWAERQKLLGTGAIGKAAQGDSVALSGDGKTALIGGPGDESGGTNLGAAWVFTRSGETWNQQGEKLLGGDATTEAERGYSVALSGDGNTALIGGFHDDDSLGAAWAFARSGSTWSEQEKLVGTNSNPPSYQGWSVALSEDGDTALVGASGDDGEVGATWVFARTPESGGEPGPPPAKPNEPGNPPQPAGNTSTGGSTSTSGNSSSTGANHPPPPPPSTPPSIIQREERLASAFGLPSAKLCFSRRSFKIHIQQPPGYPRIVSAEVFLGHKRERSLNKHGLTAQVVLTQLPYGTFTIRIVARTATGTTLTGTRTYHTCRAKPIHPHGHPRL